MTTPRKQLHAYAQSLEAKVRELTFERDAKVLDNASKERINTADNETAIEIADKNARVKNGTGLGKDKP